jgi:hypothetical protein
MPERDGESVVIDNFAPQPYPLECSPDGETWQLIIGWQRAGDGRLTPVVAPTAGGWVGPLADPSSLQYRPADTRPMVHTVAPTAAPSRRDRRT